MIVAGKGAPDGNVNASKGKETKADNVSICSDLFAEPKPRKKKADAGNSRAAERPARPPPPRPIKPRSPPAGAAWASSYRQTPPPNCGGLK